MRQPCQYGLKCPYLHLSEGGEELCTFPFVRPEDDEYGFPEDGDCALMGIDSELYDILFAYERSNTIRVAVRKEVECADREFEALVKEIKTYRHDKGKD